MHPGQMEGIGHHTYEITKRMANDHPEDHFLLLAHHKSIRSFTFPPNVTVKVIGPPARHPILYYIWFNWSVRRALNRFKADVFFSPDGIIPTWGKTPAVPVIHDIAWYHYPRHVRWRDRWFYRITTPMFCRRAPKIITVSQFSKMDLVRHYVRNPDKIIVTGNAVDKSYKPTDDIRQALIRKELTDHCDYFLFVGALHPRKNIRNLIRAFEIFKQTTGSNMKLVLAGRFAWRSKKIKKAIETSPFKQDIVLPGYIPYTDLPDLYGSAFALTYVSLYEGFGMPLLEAMACGVPVITSTVSSLPEVAGDAALLANPNDPEEIAGAMITLRKDYKLYNQLVERGLRRVRDFDWDVYAQRTYEVLRAVSR